MTYQVLARKYRPQKFAEVVGQEHITQTLKNALAAGRLHHAYLFAGARGIGKTTVARILAKALNCEKRDGPEPCGGCRSCLEISGGTSLDVQEIDGASNTGVDDVRELREGTKYLPSSGKYKIYIIDEVHMLSGNAFNALLKTLEEPPSHVIFIFATTESHKIPATILSRCQRYDFRRIGANSVAATLKRIAVSENVQIDDSALHLIAHEATGSLRDAESLFDQSIAFAGNNVTSDTIKAMLGFLDRRLLFDLVDAVIAKDSKKALASLDEVFETGADLVRFTMDVLEVLRHALVIAECGNERGVVELPPDEIDIVKRLAAKSTAPRLHQMFSAWYRVADDISRSPFPKMLLEVGLMRLCRLDDMRSIDEVVARLDAVLEGTAPETKTLPVQVSRPAPVPAPALAHSPALALAHQPAFSPVVAASDVDVEKKWEEFMRWLAVERPQASSIFQHGKLDSIDGGVVKFVFDSPLYADMLSEADRKSQVEALFLKFFKHPMRLEVSKSGQANEVESRTARKKEVVKEVLGSDIVRQAADILNAQVHDVKVEGK